MIKPDRAILLITGLWLAVHGIVFQGLPPTLSDDTLYYYLTGHRLIAGELIAERLYQPPGYILLVGLFACFLSVKTLVILQHLMVLGTGLLTLAAGRLLGRPGAGVLAGCWIVTSFYVAALAQTLLCETTALFLISTGTVFLLLYLRSSGPWPWLQLAGAGVAFGLAGTMRPIAFGVALVIALLLAALELCRHGRIELRRALRSTGVAAVFLLGAGACYLAACGVSLQATGHFELTNSKGRHLFNRVFGTDHLENPNGPRTRQLLALTGARTLKGMFWWEVFEPCLGVGMNEAQADHLLWLASAESFSTTRTELILPKYAVGTAINSVVLFLVPRELAETDASPSVKRFNKYVLEMTFSTARTQEAFAYLVGICRRFSAEWLFNLLGIAAFAGAATLMRRGSPTDAALLAVPMAAYLLGSAAVEMVEPRHVMAWMLPRTLLGVLGLQWLAAQWNHFSSGDRLRQSIYSLDNSAQMRSQADR